MVRWTLAAMAFLVVAGCTGPPSGGPTTQATPGQDLSLSIPTYTGPLGIQVRFDTPPDVSCTIQAQWIDRPSEPGASFLLIPRRGDAEPIYGQFATQATIVNVGPLDTRTEDIGNLRHVNLTYKFEAGTTSAIFFLGNLSAPDGPSEGLANQTLTFAADCPGTASAQLEGWSRNAFPLVFDSFDSKATLVQQSTGNRAIVIEGTVNHDFTAPLVRIVLGGFSTGLVTPSARFVLEHPNGTDEWMVTFLTVPPTYHHTFQGGPGSYRLRMDNVHQGGYFIGLMMGIEPPETAPWL